MVEVGNSRTWLSSSAQTKIPDGSLPAVGNGEAVTCFYCGVSMTDFGVEDVYKRHCRVSPRCHFLILQKGQEFVDATLRQSGVYSAQQQEDKVTVSLINMIGQFIIFILS